MRYGRFSGSIFWGVLVVVLGVVLLLNALLGIAIPFFSLLFAFLLIYVGMRLLVGWHRWGGGRFSRRVGTDRFAPAGTGDRHDVVFGRGDIDLTHVALQNQTVHVEVNVVFGGGEIRIDRTMPVKILATSAFGGVRLPDGNATAFGDYVWRSPSMDESKPCLMLHVTAVFGGVRIYA